jgi:hypothetical protein
MVLAAIGCMIIIESDSLTIRKNNLKRRKVQCIFVGDPW